MIPRMTVVAVHALRAHRVRDLNDFSGKWSTVQPLVHTVPGWRLLGEELWQGVRAPLGVLTCNRCSNRLKDDKLLRTNPYFCMWPHCPSSFCSVPPPPPLAIATEKAQINAVPTPTVAWTRP